MTRREILERLADDSERVAHYRENLVTQALAALDELELDREVLLGIL